MTSPISSFVTPLASARSRCPVSWSARPMAISPATVMRLRSRLESSGRSQTSPYTTFSLSSISLGATLRTSSRAVIAACGVLTDGSFRRLAAPYVSIARATGRIDPATLEEARYAPMARVDDRGAPAVHARHRPRPDRARDPRGCGQGHELGRGQIDRVERQRRVLRPRPELHTGPAVAEVHRQEPDAEHELRDRLIARRRRAHAGREP